MARSLSFRRHHNQRIKDREKRKRSELPSFWKEATVKAIGMAANTPCMCSCYMCGNYRKHYGPTLSEIVYAISHSEQINEL